MKDDDIVKYRLALSQYSDDKRGVATAIALRSVNLRPSYAASPQHGPSTPAGASEAGSAAMSPLSVSSVSSTVHAGTPDIASMLPEELKPLEDAFLSLALGEIILVLSVDGPPGCWIARGRDGTVGFVMSAWVEMERLTMADEDVAQLLEKTRIEVMMDDINGTHSPGSNQTLQERHVKIGRKRSESKQLSTALAPPARANARSISPSLSRRSWTPHQRHKTTNRTRRATSDAAARQATADDSPGGPAAFHPVAFATVLKACKRPAEGYLLLSKGQHLYILRLTPDVRGTHTARDSTGQVGLVNSTDIEVESYFTKFGTDLTEMYINTKRQVPLVVESCVRAIRLYGMDEEGVFRVPGSKSAMFEMRSIFERGDDPIQGEEAKFVPVENIAGLLKEFLRQLPNPVIPHKLYDTVVAMGRMTSLDKRIAAARETVSNYLAPSHANVLRVLLPFLHDLSQHSDTNKMSASNLALVFGPTLMRRMAADDDQEQTLLDDETAIKSITRTLIEHYPAIFDTAASTTPASHLDADATHALAVDPEDWSSWQLLNFLREKRHRLSEDVISKFKHMDGASFVELDHEALLDMGLTQAQALQVSSVIFQLSDPRARLSDS